MSHGKSKTRMAPPILKPIEGRHRGYSNNLVGDGTCEIVSETRTLPKEVIPNETCNVVENRFGLCEPETRISPHVRGRGVRSPARCIRVSAISSGHGLGTGFRLESCQRIVLVASIVMHAPRLLGTEMWKKHTYINFFNQIGNVTVMKCYDLGV